MIWGLLLGFVCLQRQAVFHDAFCLSSTQLLVVFCCLCNDRLPASFELLLLHFVYNLLNERLYMSVAMQCTVRALERGVGHKRRCVCTFEFVWIVALVRAFLLGRWVAPVVLGTLELVPAFCQQGGECAQDL